MYQDKKKSKSSFFEISSNISRVYFLYIRLEDQKAISATAFTTN